MAPASARLRALAWLACGLAFILVAFGAFVRLSDAGLSCPDWPTCYGQVAWPSTPSAVANADAAFPQRPVEVHRAWREQTHRFLAATLGFLVLLQALWAAGQARRRLGLIVMATALIAIAIPFYMAGMPRAAGVAGAIGEGVLLAIALIWPRGAWRRVAVLALAMVCFQALLGMWTVTWLLLPVVVTAHLLGGLATLALLSWLAWRLRAGPAPVRFSRLRVPAITGVALLAVQLFLGGWTSSNYAGLACGAGGAAFPQCLGHWWPVMNFDAGFTLWRTIGVDYQGGVLDGPARTAIQMMHRMGALVVFLYGLWLARAAMAAGLRRHGAALALVVTTQVALGIANVVLALPLWLAEAHTICAALLLFLLVALWARTALPDVQSLSCPK